MATLSLSGSDTIKINQRLITDFPDGDIAKLTYDTDHTTLKRGKNGNTIYVGNEAGKAAKLELRVLRGSADDKYLEAIEAVQVSNLPSFVLMSGMIAKKIGDGAGNVGSDIYDLSGGVFTKFGEVTSNVEGEKEQAVRTYTIMFATAPRAIV